MVISNQSATDTLLSHKEPHLIRNTPPHTLIETRSRARLHGPTGAVACNRAKDQGVGARRHLQCGPGTSFHTPQLFLSRPA